MAKMKRFEINSSLAGDCVVSADARAGELYHVVKNGAGGSMMTPIARYFVWRPEFVEGFRKHWRVDCYIHDHKLSPSERTLKEMLIPALKKEGLCEEPVWLSLHQSKEVDGLAFGQVFEEDDDGEK
jgi:hypothetical protein